MALTGGLVVLLRYGFNTGSVRLEESLVYMQSVLLALMVASCQQWNAHVRLGLFYEKFSVQKRALTDLLGHLFLLCPLALALLVFSWEYVLNSWRDLEQSAEPGGIPFLYLPKTLLLVLPVLLLLQCVSGIRASYLLYRGHKSG